MSGGPFHNPLFKRHSRPQQPTLPAPPPGEVAKPRAIQPTPSWQPALSPIRTQSTSSREVSESGTLGWVNFFQLGKLIQGDSEMIVCTSTTQRSKLFMFKEIDEDDGAIAKLLQGFRHRNILPVQHVVSSDIKTHIGFDYVRCTLAEVLSVHVPLQERHIHCLAVSIFDALRYLNQRGYVHGNVSANSIRLCGRTGQVYLGDLDRCTRIDKESNVDLEDLGLVLLDCMENDGLRRARTVAEVRKQRSANKAFGLSDPERWSSFKRLIDFLDDLFSLQRRPAEKINKPHSFALQRLDEQNSLYPWIQLAQLECVSMWQIV